MIYGHGDDAFSYGDKVKINFSSNVYSQADYTELKEHLMQHFEVVGHYPEPDAHSLECLLAKQLGIKENTIMVTSGANEAIYLIAQLYKGWASIIPPPTFSEYEDACRMFNHIISYDVKDEFDVLPQDRIYWICNPNNPTGNVLVKGMLNHIVRNHPRYLYVIDQSYADYTLAPMIEPKEMTDVFNVMLIHSLSKTFCIPGLRLGYIVASPIIIGRLKQIRQPWTINALAIEAGKYLIENHIQMIHDLKSYLQEAIRLYANLSAINGLKVMKTDTNFMLVSIHNSTAIELKRWLLDNYGILIRDASNIRGLDSNYFRVTAQQPEENDLLVEAIKAYIDQLNEVSD
ncbi:MAG: aminotransferase class I/II-fold pyridoxal phosphate-dependent enzyme [Prevotella ruminicola]|uniref:Aminotransferase class I/II-fold pyridoxal phosphate-dependent enzyme n=1 Tax=Xylanibacter ruminicola TaxID=839 RepID=A0A9D5NZT5_XYLRU|nr:aminotransferase class I/II-fold pyridoxal phosphate-dependent enzyme [Xylanibacter ruminicola]